MNRGAYVIPSYFYDWLKVEDNYGIYNKDGETDWYIASSRGWATADTALWSVNGKSGGWTASVSPRSVRPIVCIQTTVFNYKYKLADE